MTLISGQGCFQLSGNDIQIKRFDPDKINKAILWWKTRNGRIMGVELIDAECN